MRVSEVDVFTDPLLRRVAHVDEVTQFLLFLADPNSASMTGAAIAFDGGFTTK